MAYIVARPKGSWDLRRSRTTAAGPRSETLVTFKELTDEAIERAVDRSGGSLTDDQIRAAALRAGAPIALDPARAAAATLMRELVRGAELPSGWRQPLVGLLSGSRADDDGTAIGEWADASAERRGEALYDLLLLADALPKRRRPDQLGFPRLVTVER